MKKVIVRSPQSDRTQLEIPESLSDLIGNSTVDVAFSTGSTLVANYPIVIDTDHASIIGVQLVKATNITAPSNVTYEAIQLTHWTASGGTITVNYISGLSTNCSYLFTLVIYAE